jgi:hypothetical protein
MSDLIDRASFIGMSPSAQTAYFDENGFVLLPGCGSFSNALSGSLANTLT